MKKAKASEEVALIEQVSEFEKRMKQKSDELALVSLFWVFGIAGSIWFLTSLGQKLFMDLLPVATGSSVFGPTVVIDSDLFVRLVLIFPALYAIYLSVSEFRTARRLKESYDFKISVAESLLYFSTMVFNAREDKTGSQKFLMNTINDLLTPTADKIFDARTAENIEGRVQKMIDGMASTVTSATKITKAS